MSVPLEALDTCFEGAVPAVIVTAAADGTPNTTYLSKVRRVDHERIALSNQFFSKTARNLAVNPRASLLIVDPVTYDEYRLSLVFERTERRGPLFDRLRDDIDLIAALTDMRDVFVLRAADIYRVRSVERVPMRPLPSDAAALRVGSGLSGKALTVELGQLTGRLSRCGDLDSLVDTAVAGLDELLGYRHVTLLLLDPAQQRLVTLASRGYPSEGVGSEVELGAGVVGLAAQRCQPVRVGNLRQVDKYTSTVRRSYEHQGDTSYATEIPLPDLSSVESQLAVPAMALGELVGVLMVESTVPVAFDDGDEAVLSVVASVLANAVVAERPEPDAPQDRSAPAPAADGRASLRVKSFAVDGSVFFDDDYVIKGVAGRILWSLLDQHQRSGRVEFTNKELRLDPSLELPEFRDNLESRLILLKRRLDERDAPVRIVKTGRGRFRLDVERPVALERLD